MGVHTVNSTKPKYLGENPPLARHVDRHLEMGEHDQFKSPDVVGTGAVKPCLAMVVYSPAERAAEVLHLHGHLSAKANEATINRSLCSFSDRSRIRIYLAGLSDSTEDREVIVRLCKLAGYTEKQIFFRWCEPDQNQQILINLRTGEVNYAEETDPDSADFCLASESE